MTVKTPSASGMAAAASGALRAASGDYTSAWLLAGVLAVAAAVGSLMLPRRLLESSLS